MKLRSLFILFFSFLILNCSLEVPGIAGYLGALYSILPKRISAGSSNTSTATATTTGTSTSVSTSTSTNTSLALPTLSYSGPYISFLGNSISITPTTTGVISSCQISPALPGGLSISNSNCSISGSPVSSSTGKTYTVTASNSSGNVTATLIIKIQSTTAFQVFGQGGSFTSNSAAISATGLNGPYHLAFDSSGNVYVSEYNNNRVLYFPSGSTTATKVYGQATFATNSAGVGTTGLSAQEGLAVDSAGNLYVTDLGNNRILYFPSGSTTATNVYGQFGSYVCNVTNNNGSCVSLTPSPDNLSNPCGVAVDSSNGVYISDNNNHRILYYASGSTTASRVYGHSGSFTCAVSNDNGSCVSAGPTANNLNAPCGITLDVSGNLYVADQANNRVLKYISPSTTATTVYGQAGSFTTAVSGTSATTFNAPSGVALDSLGNVYVSDLNNFRALLFPPGSLTASQVFGQFGSFTCAVANNNGSCAGGTPSANNVNALYGIAVDPFGNLYLPDASNNRVLVY